MGILDDLRRLFADAEVSLVGARDERIEAERALEAGDWFRARAAARRVLDRAPRSPIGYALLADACEGARLDAELEEALTALARMAGASPDVWLRLGRVRTRVGAPQREIRDAFTRAVAWDGDPDAEKARAAREARLSLADIELAEGSPARAEGWIAPIADTRSDVVRRRLACAVARRVRDEVARWVADFTPEVSDAHGQRLLGEAQLLLGDNSNAVRALCRAAMLDDAVATDALREAVARSTLDAPALRAAEAVAEARGLSNAPLWRAALSAARGDASAAATALRDALASGVELPTPSERAAGRALAVAARDSKLLEAIGSKRSQSPTHAGQRDSLTGIDAALALADRASVTEDTAAVVAALDALGASTDDPARVAWAQELAHRLLERLAPKSSPAQWDVLTDRIAGHARALGDFDALRRLEHLASERARGVRIAIVGEFNAGKSTFVNALLGMDVAPTGILPTTAVAHVLRFGPDPIARARLKIGGARTVPPERLKSLLAELGEGAVTEVEVEVPFPYLQRVEIVDTPGFNAPDPEHAKIAMATLIDGAGVDLALWLFDVGQPLKTSERRVLEAIVARGIPLQLLLNKSDRLSAADLDKVMTTFGVDARSIDLSSFRPALAFSARRAVEARISGDESALAESGFLPVRALLEDELPAHGAVLKERGLRRRAHDIAVSLSDAATRMQNDEAARRAEREASSARLLLQASTLERAAVLDLGGVDVAPAVAGKAGESKDEIPHQCRRLVRDELRTAIDAYRRERDDLLAKDEPTMATYLERRLAEHVEAAAARAMAAVLDKSGVIGGSSAVLDELWIDAAGLARGFAAGGPQVVDVRAGGDGGKGRTIRADVEGTLVRALLGVVSARLRAQAVRRDDEGDRSFARARELRAMVELLAPPPVASAQQ